VDAITQHVLESLTVRCAICGQQVRPPVWQCLARPLLRPPVARWWVCETCWERHCASQAPAWPAGLVPTEADEIECLRIWAWTTVAAGLDAELCGAIDHREWRAAHGGA